jgi:uncharacterized protein HemX
MNTPVDSPVSSPPPRPVGTWIALVLSGVALVLAGWSYFDSRERLRELKTDIGRHLTEMDGALREVRLLARNADDATRQSAERLSRIEAEMARSQAQQLALEALYKELSQGRDQWTLAEIEQVLLTAAQQLQLAGNVRAAIIALESADTRLERLGKPQFTPLRRAIAMDLAKLRATPYVDDIGLAARIEALVSRLDDWPLASAQSAAERARATGTRAGGLAEELLGEIKRLVQVRRIDSREGVLLPPDQAYFLRENLRLRLLSARLALLARDQAGFRADLGAAARLLRQYFNLRDPGVAAALAELDALGRLTITVPVPDIQASLAALESLKGTH